MSFDFDPHADDSPALPELDRIDTQDQAGDRGTELVAIHIDHDLCEDSGACALVCPEDVIANMSGHATVVAPEACTECWICVENCVAGAIEIL